MIKTWFIATIAFALGIKAVVEIRGCRNRVMCRDTRKLANITEETEEPWDDAYRAKRKSIMEEAEKERCGVNGKSMMLMEEIDRLDHEYVERCMKEDKWPRFTK